jgi:hypothetical protein
LGVLKQQAALGYLITTTFLYDGDGDILYSYRIAQHLSTIMIQEE